MTTIYRITGKDMEVRIASSEEGLATAPKIPHVMHFECDPGQAFSHEPDGFGVRTCTVQDGLIKPKGQIRREYDTAAVRGTDTFWNAVQATNTGAISANYIEIKDLLNLRKIVIRGAKGNCPRSVDLEGYMTETWDFLANEFSDTSYS